MAQQAQFGPPPEAATPGQSQQSPHKFLDRFNAANTSHDGRLTLQQAQAGGMRWIAGHFSEIDAQRKGYITIQDVRAYRQATRTAPAGGSQQAAAPQQQAHRFLDRFNAANTSHDGKLTLAQAQAAHMPWITQNFASIDMQHKDYITIDEIRAYRRQLRTQQFETN